jgi:hypothetical protein
LKTAFEQLFGLKPDIAQQIDRLLNSLLQDSALIADCRAGFDKARAMPDRDLQLTLRVNNKVA